MRAELPWDLLRADAVDALMLAGCGHYQEGLQVLDLGLTVAECCTFPDGSVLVADYRKALMAYVDLFQPDGLIDQILAETGEPAVNAVMARLLHEV